jgi:DNA-binding transcriptional LysR family regulator
LINGCLASVLLSQPRIIGGTVELRDIEIFLTLAEELHFGRTADRLHITPARVSQSIKKQERRIGVPLFDRTTRTVALTPVGRQLLDELRPNYRGLQDTLQRAVDAAAGTTGVLRLGMLASNLDDLRPMLDLFRARHPCFAVEITHTHFGDPFGPLRRKEIDLQITWLPIHEPDLATGPLVYTERIVMAVAADHPLATKPWVSYEDLGDYRVPAVAAPDYWTAAIAPFHTPAGRPVRRGQLVANFQELITAVAAGNTICPVHDHANRYYTRPDIRYLPITDAPLSKWAAVWRRVETSDVISAFNRVVEESGPVQL